MLIRELSPAELAGSLRAGKFRLHVPPYTFAVRSASPVVCGGIRQLYGDYPVAPETAFVDFHVTVEERRGLRSRQSEFWFNGERPFTPLAREEAYAFLEWGLNWCVSTHCHEFLILHAAALERNGRVLLLPAPPGSGKSTLCAALMFSGWRLFTDELALIDPADGRLWPHPRPVSLKNRSIDIIRDMASGASFGPVAHDTRKGTVSHVAPTSVSIAGSEQAAPVGWIIFPRWKADARLEATPVPRSHAVPRLAENAFNFGILGTRGFEALTGGVSGASCWNLEYGSLEEALRFVEELAASPCP